MGKTPLQSQGIQLNISLKQRLCPCCAGNLACAHQLLVTGKDCIEYSARQNKTLRTRKLLYTRRQPYDKIVKLGKERRLFPRDYSQHYLPQ